MHLTAIDLRWYAPNLDKWVIGRWMLGFAKIVHPNLRAGSVTANAGVKQTDVNSIRKGSNLPINRS